MLPPFNPYPLHSTKDIRGHPYFQGAVSRWAWRICTIRITRPGMWFLGLTVAFAMYGATSLDLQVFVPFTYAAGIWLMALILAQARTPRIALTVRHAPRIEAGRTLSVDVEAQAGRHAIYDAMLLPNRLPPAIDAVPLEGVTLGTLRPHEAKRVTIGLRCARRGRYVLRGWRVQTDFPFGMLRSFATIGEESSLLVTPQFTPLTEFALPVRRSNQPGGAALSTARGESLEFIGDREFREGDSIRDIDWRATARLDRLVVREFREEYLHRTALVLDTGTTDAGAFEAAVSLCAAASEVLARQQYAVDFVAAGPGFVSLEGGLSLTAHNHVLDVLATLVPSAAWETPPEMQERLEQISVAVCFFLDWDQARREFAAQVERAGAAARIIIVRDGPCTLDPAQDGARPRSISHITPAQVEDGTDTL